MKKKDEDFFICEVCNTCKNKCKRPINKIFQKSFENKTASFSCPKHEKPKKEKIN